ncbi:MAG: hypothetical protein VX223_09985 [Myxococcota bacterium]|nr:hypothetical protein [Myxococcota bacterium]
MTTANNKQAFRISRGATCLLCAAIALGVAVIPNYQAVHPLWKQGSALAEGPTRAAETMIYAVTSGAEYLPYLDNGYPMLSLIDYAAQCESRQVARCAEMMVGTG